MWDMNYPQIMSPSPLPLKMGVMSPSSYGSAAHVWTTNCIEGYYQSPRQHLTVVSYSKMIFLAGKVTAGLVESNDSLRPGLSLMSPAGWLSTNGDQISSVPNARNRVSDYFIMLPLFFVVECGIAHYLYIVRLWEEKRTDCVRRLPLRWSSSSSLSSWWRWVMRGEAVEERRQWRRLRR